LFRKGIADIKAFQPQNFRTSKQRGVFFSWENVGSFAKLPGSPWSLFDFSGRYIYTFRGLDIHPALIYSYQDFSGQSHGAIKIYKSNPIYPMNNHDSFLILMIPAIFKACIHHHLLYLLSKQITESIRLGPKPPPEVDDKNPPEFGGGFFHSQISLHQPL